MNLGGSVKINKFGLSVLAFVIIIFILYHLSGSSSNTSTSPLVGKSGLNEISLRKVLIGAIMAAEHGGEEVLKVYNSKILNTQTKGKTKEGVVDPVTDADFNSHCTMVSGLEHLFPKVLKIVSEEGHSKEKCSESLRQFDLNPTVLGDTNIPDIMIPADQLTVWIDPLDATKEFTENLTQYVTTMVCVAVNGRPVIGVVHNPFPSMKATTWAWDGHAYSQDLANRKKEEAIDSNTPVLIVSRSHAGDMKDVAKQIFGDKVQIITAAGAGYKVLQVIFNNATAYMHKTVIKKWDLCAGNAILNSLGGKMTDFKGNELSYIDDGNYVHSSGLLATMSNHETYVEKLKDLKLT